LLLLDDTPALRILISCTACLSPTHHAARYAIAAMRRRQCRTVARDIIYAMRHATAQHAFICRALLCDDAAPFSRARCYMTSNSISIICASARHYDMPLLMPLYISAARQQQPLFCCRLLTPMPLPHTAAAFTQPVARVR